MVKKKIITVTFNPALNLIYQKEYFHPGYKNTTNQPATVNVDGSGINISNALNQMEINTTAYILLGSDLKGQLAEQLLSKYQIEITPFFVLGQTRSKVTIFDPNTDTETIITDTSCVEYEHVSEQFNKKIISNINKNDIVVLSENLPEGYPRRMHTQLIDQIHSAGGKVCLISRGINPEIYQEDKPEYLAIKLRELEKIFNYPVRTVEDIIECVKKIIDNGVINVLIEAPKKNQAFLFNKENAYVIDYDESCSDGTKDGGWYAFIAGFLAGKMNHISLKESLEYATSAALYFSDQVGHQYPTIDDVKDGIEQVTATKLEIDEQEEEQQNE
jgi:fructose-1-phosphate kinase PfkB-like protein